MSKYNHQSIETKWQKHWQDNQTFAAKLPTKKKRSQKYCSKGNAVRLSQSEQILFDSIKEVKKKKNRRKFSQLKKIQLVNNKTYIFDGETLIHHFNAKSPGERRSRMFWGQTVIAAIPKLKFVDTISGYFVSKERIINVIFSQVDETTFLLKTYYESKKLTRKYWDYLDQKPEKPKFYALDMFPYPSGAGLHVGHPLGYTATDIICRKKRHQGFNVLHPMGWDAFGLPAENYAVKTGIHPAISTQTNIDNFRRQIQSLGFSYDWQREFATTDEEYYRWTQWIFLKLYDRGLLYEKEMPMNWCPKCKVVAANEEVESGKHERCSAEVEKKNLKQWMFRITDYAERLLTDLSSPNIYILHGWGADSQSNWFETARKFLTDKDVRVQVPNFPNSQNPSYEDWKTHFETQHPTIWPQDVIICHSLGGGFIQRYLSEKNIKIDQLILVAPAIGDCGIDEIKNFFHKEKSVPQSRRGHTKGNQRRTHFESILPTRLCQVKKKKTKQKISEIEKKVPTQNGIIQFNGLDLWQHWQTKSRTEKIIRQDFAQTVIRALSTIKFDSNNVGYFESKNKIFCVVLSEIETNVFQVKTFYQAQKFTRLYKEYQDNKVIDYPKIKESCNRISIYASDDDQYIKVEEFEFLADKLNADINWLNGRGHLMEPEFPELFDHLSAIEKSILDWPDKIKAMQRNWIGKSEGAEVDFALSQNQNQKIRVYTTRPDTLFGATYFVLSPEHPLVAEVTTSDQKNAITAYQQVCQAKSELERTELNKNKTGVFTGAYVINPVNDKKIPVWIADYVMMGYGTGAIMAVPAHDERDHEFAIKYDLPVIPVVDGLKDPFAKNGGTLINSDFLDGLDIPGAKNKIIDWLATQKTGEKKVNYKLRDWIFTRQRYWGEPIPLVFDEAGKIYPLADSELPLVLPDTPNYEPCATGESPLAKIDTWVNVKGYITESGHVITITDTNPAPEGVETKKFRRETSTMPNWAGSNWYWLRFMDAGNPTEFLSAEAENYWGPVDLYVGGAEHAVLHLLYGRFWHKVFYDMGLVTTKEPFKKLVNQGLILAEDGVKMSKSLGNVVNPDEIVSEFGADTLRCYEMFMGPFEQSKSWSGGSVNGTRKWLDRVWRIFEKEITEQEISSAIESTLHKTIKTVGEHIDEFKFNTAISQLMVLTNELTSAKNVDKSTLETFAILISPFAPHIAEEFWNQLGHTDSIAYATWPTYDEKFLVEDTVTYAVQINGKVRADFSVPADTSKEEALKQAKSLEKIQKYFAEGEIRKEIFVPGKIIGFVVK
jgi:leucyl-tRNA synthetase